MSVSRCPDYNQLLAYHRGEMDEVAAQGLTEHLGFCSLCQETLHGLPASEDTLIDHLRRPRQPDPFEQEPERLQLIQRVKAMRLGGVDETVDIGSSSGPAAELADKFVAAELGEYQLQEKLGQGGMGAVYRAIHTRLKRTVAVKVLPQDRTGDTRAVARFEREMEAVGRLSHPNIVQAHDAREIEGTHFLVMEYVEGRDLSDLARSLGPLPIADACEIVRQAALGLQYAHDNGLVHRDIKPSNLMLNRNGQVKILDLGLARLQEDQPAGREMTAAGQVMGTAEYMAPEQVIDSHSAGAAADQYSLGCTLYKLLAGQPPFPSRDFKSPFQTMMAHAQQPITSITALRPDVPQPLAESLARMVAKTPEERFAGMSDVAAALEPFASGADLLRLVGPAGMDPASSTELKRGSTDQFRSSAHVSALPSVKVSPQVSTRRGGANRWPPRTIALATAPLFALLLLGVVFYFRGVKFEVQDGSEVVISDDDGVKIASPAAPAGAEQSESQQEVASPARMQSGYDAAYERETAEWLISLGVIADIQECSANSAKKPHGASMPEHLPDGDFLVVGAHFMELTKEPLKDSIVDRLAQLHDFQSLTVRYCENQMTEAGLERLANSCRMKILDIGGLQSLNEVAMRQIGRLTELRELNIGDSGLGNNELQHIGGLKRLETLNIGKLDIDDHGLAPLKNLSELETLYMGWTRVTNEGLRTVAGCEKLRALGLESLRITGEGLQVVGSLPHLEDLRLFLSRCHGGLGYLASHRQLRVLILGATDITDDDLTSLQGLNQLEQLVLGDTEISDVGLAAVTAFPNLQELHLGNTKITDNGLIHIRNLKKLRVLDLSKTSVSDTGLAVLSDLGQLDVLRIHETQVSAEALLEFRTKLPYCRIETSPEKLSEMEKLEAERASQPATPATQPVANEQASSAGNPVVPADVPVGQLTAVDLDAQRAAAVWLLSHGAGLTVVGVDFSSPPDNDRWSQGLEPEEKDRHY